MNTSILLMSGGAVVVLVLLLVLAIGGGATYLIVREKKRKEKARERAAQRRKAREEALQRARSGMPDAFDVPEENPTVTPSEEPTLSESQKLQRLEARKADLNTLRLVRENEADTEMADTASRRFSTSRLGRGREEKAEVKNTEPETEEKKDGVSAGVVAAGVAAAAGLAAAGAAAAQETEKKVDFRKLAGRLDDVDEVESKSDFKIPAEELARMEAEDRAAEEAKAKAEAEAKARAEAEAKAAEEARLQAEAEAKAAEEARLKEEAERMEAARKKAEEEDARKAAEDAKAREEAAIAAGVHEMDNSIPVFRTEEEKQEEVSAFKPYKDEYEDLANDYERRSAAKQHEAYAAEAVAKTPSISEPVDDFTTTPVEPAQIAEIADEAGEIEPAVEAVNAVDAEAEEEITSEMERSEEELETIRRAEEEASAKLVAEEAAAKEAAEREAARKAALAQEAFKRGETASFETTRLTPEEKAAAREARMAEKAKFAAALAGEIEIEGIENTVELEPIVDEYDEEEEEESTSGKGVRVFLWILAAILALICIGSIAYLFFGSYLMPKSGNSSEPSSTVSSVTESSDTSSQSSEEQSSETSEVISETSSESSEESSEESEESIPEPVVYTTFIEEPHAVDSTQPSNLDIDWDIYAMGEIQESFEREMPITFGEAGEYTELEGVVTFRGNNYRNDAVYGDVNLSEGSFEGTSWTYGIGSLASSDGGSWTGCGWTGQPLIVQWPEETKQVMNMYEEKKAKEDLVEVIYATLDGCIYFLDLEDGSQTRDVLYIGMTFKGAGALDPRGYPLMYVGSGDYNAYGTAPHMFIISLIDGEILWSEGSYDEFAYRSSWSAFDSSPIVDAETDTLIWPGENGVFYTMKLNTEYNKTEGTISVDPEVVKARYDSERSYQTYYGMESSIVCFDHYGYVSDNTGYFFCFDLNTMELVWVQDTLDDSNSTPVFEFDETTGRGYIYTAPSLHWTADYNASGMIPIYKLDAITGEIIWKTEYDCRTISEISGGVQSTPALGREGTDLEGTIFYTIARCEGFYIGKLAAIDTETGEEKWSYDMDNYTWSSPVCVYDENGHGYVIMFDSVGAGFLLDGVTGEVLDTISAGWLVEASPAVWGNKVVVGTRGSQIYCFELK